MAHNEPCVIQLAEHTAIIQRTIFVTLCKLKYM